jgi:very-short-patch-repair endonuclease
LKIYYNPKLKERAKELRKNATFSERILWKHLKNSQLLGCKFTRQKPIDSYIVDFYCSKLHLVIEIDGITHDGKVEYDLQRENNLKKIGIEVIRFDGHYVIKQIDETLKVIAHKIEDLRSEISL